MKINHKRPFDILVSKYGLQLYSEITSVKNVCHDISIEC